MQFLDPSKRNRYFRVQNQSESEPSLRNFLSSLLRSGHRVFFFNIYTYIDIFFLHHSFRCPVTACPKNCFSVSIQFIYFGQVPISMIGGV